jgi:hypothetical protein
MTRENRRFPFSSSKMNVNVANVPTAHEQIYPMLRDYFAIHRPVMSKNKFPAAPLSYSNDRHEYRLLDFGDHLKRTRIEPSVENDEVTTLREAYFQHCKAVKQRWQSFYRDEIKQRKQTLSDNLIETSDRSC